jgi:hypothetical protein
VWRLVVRDAPSRFGLCLGNAEFKTAVGVEDVPELLWMWFAPIGNVALRPFERAIRLLQLFSKALLDETPQHRIISYCFILRRLQRVESAIIFEQKVVRLLFRVVPRNAIHGSRRNPKPEHVDKARVWLDRSRGNHPMIFTEPRWDRETKIPTRRRSSGLWSHSSVNKFPSTRPNSNRSIRRTRMRSRVGGSKKIAVGLYVPLLG